MTICSGCGYPVDSAFCVRCGRPAPTNAATTVEPRSAATPVAISDDVDATTDAAGWRPPAAPAPMWETPAELYRGDDTVLSSSVPVPPPVAQAGYAPGPGTQAAFPGTPQGTHAPAPGTYPPAPQGGYPGTPGTRPAAPQAAYPGTPPGTYPGTPSGGYVPGQPYPAPYGGPQPHQQPRRSKAPAIIAGVLAGVLVVGGGVLLGPQLLGLAGVNASTSTAKPKSASPSASGSSSASKSAVPTITQPAQTQTPAAASCPAGSTTCAEALPMPGFVMVLESQIKTANTLQSVQAAAQGLARGGVTPRVLDSSQTAGMNPGFWVVATGPYTTQAEAEASCAAMGRTVGPDCYVREATQAPTLASRGDMAQWAGECRAVNTPDLEGCIAPYEFLQRYALIDNAKSMQRADVGNWWTEPASFYGRDYNLDQMAAVLTTPTKAGTVYGKATLVGITYGVPDARWTTVTDLRVRLPYTKNGVAGTAIVRYLVTAGTGANRFRITQVDEP